MDRALPGISGIDATRRIRAKMPNATVLMLSMHSEDTLVRQALEAGARGYILKNALELDLVSAVKRVAEGHLELDPQLSKPAALNGERDSGLTSPPLTILRHIPAANPTNTLPTPLFLIATTSKVSR